MGTPVEVWEAITRGAAGWLWPLEFETREGGLVSGLTAEGDTVLVWDPPRRLTVRGEGADGWFNNLEYHLEAWDRGTFLRYTHTGVLDEQNWDNEYEACRQHTKFYYHSLGVYVRYFTGRQATYVSVDAPEVSAVAGSFAKVRTAIGLTHNAIVGDRVRFDVSGLDPIDGIVDYLTDNFVGVRTPDGLYRFYGRDAFGWPIGAALHLFAADVDRDKVQEAWATWLDGLYG